MLFKNTSKRIMSICASGRDFTAAHILCGISILLAESQKGVKGEVQYRVY